MNPQIIIILAVLIAAVILFVTEKIPVDVVALMVMAILILSGILSPEEGFMGFSNEATVTIAAMYILSQGLFKTGVVNYIGRIFIKIYKRRFWLANSIMLFVSGVISAFINNTTQVALTLPVLLKVSKETKVSASKLLLPLSYVTVFGGILALIGTSTNILVSSLAKQLGQPPLSMFEFTPLASIFFIVGLIYLIFIGIRLLPERRTDADLTTSFGLGEYLTEIIIKKESGFVGKKINDVSLVKDLGIEIIEIIRNDDRLLLPSPMTFLHADDRLRIKADVEKIKELKEKTGILLKPGLKWRDEELQGVDVILVEAVISPHSFLIGKNLKELRFRNSFGATVLAIRHRGVIMYENVATTTLMAGDALLIEISKANFDRLRENQAFVFVSEVEPPTFKKSKIIISILIMFGVVAAASIEILPISTAAVVGCVLLVLTRCVSLENAYRSIDWQVIMLLAGSISLGLAMQKTGTAKFLADSILSIRGSFSPTLILSAFYLVTLILTETMSNNATAALMTPIAVSTALSLHLNPRPFLITVMFAASLAFMMPVGYQTHLMIFNPGRYRISDFIKVGTPLNIIFWILASLLIPVFFPF
ncbi:MAG TPA: SLC13 family permease [Ignavibacteriaceae bacterium]|nr:SLC13 family permease [Ignavibacteriaceae bacterium]